MFVFVFHTLFALFHPFLSVIFFALSLIYSPLLFFLANLPYTSSGSFPLFVMFLVSASMFPYRSLSFPSIGRITVEWPKFPIVFITSKGFSSLLGESSFSRMISSEGRQAFFLLKSFFLHKNKRFWVDRHTLKQISRFISWVISRIWWNWRP